MEAIQRLVADHPSWSRRKLSIELSQVFEWRTATGQLRDMAARHLLKKLEERGWIKLPPRQRRGGKRVLRVLQEQPDFFAPDEPAPIGQSLKSLQPLEILIVEPGHVASGDFVRYLARFHYLGFGGETGSHLRYLVRDRFGRDLACLLFGGAAWQVKARETFIGWSADQRRQRLGSVINNTRFLILPHVQVPHLASHILGRILRRIADDWQRKYATRPSLAETFVERDRFAGVCYRAANWQLIG
jgi:hypothetical protein